MSRQKRKRFEANLTAANVLEDNKPIYHELKGNWHEKYFQNDFPITLELGCGKGEYTIGLSKIYPKRNFVGVDVKGDRLFVGSQQAMVAGMAHVAFLRTLIQNLGDFFDENEVDVIWITFPDPRPKERDVKRRLTSPRFLEVYKYIVKPGGWLYFKTDNKPLFEYTLEVLAKRTDIQNLKYTFDLYQSAFMDEHHGIKTQFEQKFQDLGENIKYLKFQFIQ